MPRLFPKAPCQGDRYSSSWTPGEVIRLRLWRLTWAILFRPSPKILNAWRLRLLRLFGARISGRPFVYSSAKVFAPFLLKLEDHACLGPGSEVYNLGPVTFLARATLSQQAYVCNGTHDFDDERLPLLVGDMTIGEDAFIGARAFIMPGVNVGDHALVGACAVVTKDVERWGVVAGNPARLVRIRQRPRACGHV